MPQVKHLVLIKFKPTTSLLVIDQCMDDLRGLKTKIAGILDFCGGPYASGEGLNQGFTHGFIMTFDAPASRDNYLIDPEHEKVKNSILPLVDGVIAFDFDV